MTPEREAEIRQHLVTLGVFFTPTDLMIRELLEEIDRLRLKRDCNYVPVRLAPADFPERNPVEPAA